MQTLLKKVLSELQNYGERPILQTPFEAINPVLQFAYIWAAKKAENKSVLDFGCGGGYGTSYVARFTKKPVVGFDIDFVTIKKTQEYFSSIKNLSFVSDSAKISQYDMIVCFQVIEHMKLDILRKLIADIKNNYLKKGGTFLVATVNKNISSYKLKKSVLPFHEHEFYPQELKIFLEKEFKQVKLYGQIDIETKKLVLTGKKAFERMDYSVKSHMLRIISQFEPVRAVARHTPLFLKNFLTHTKQEDMSVQYELATEKKLVDNSYIILCECQ